MIRSPRTVLIALGLAVSLLQFVGFNSPLPAAETPTSQLFSFRVSKPGLVSIPWSAIPHIPRLANVHVWRQGVEVPLQVSDDAIQFVAEANDSPFSTEAVYWLNADDVPGKRTSLPAVLAAPLYWEQDKTYQPIAATNRGDRWFAGELREHTSLAITLDLPTAVAAGTEFQLHVTPLVRREGHRIYAHINGALVGTAYWNDGATTGPKTQPLALLTSLPAGQVRLELVVTSVGLPEDVVLLDRLEVPTVQVPLPMLPTPQLLPAVIHDFVLGPTPGQQGASYVIITHSLFRPALDPLIAAHQQRGDTVAVVDVQSIYDRFSYGERNPEAIRMFLRTALSSWPTVPRAALLVGAGSARMRSEDSASDPTFIPPYLIHVDPKYGEVACDSCFARVAPDVRSQLVPTIPIGRFPVHTLAEAHTLVAKTVAALTAPPLGSWRSTVLAVSDNDYEPSGAADSAGAFTNLTEHAIQLLPKFHATRFYYAPDRVTAPPYYTDPETLRGELFAAWDRGAALMLYAGHASPWQWAFTSAESTTPYLVGLYDADRRSNGKRLPILLSLDCLSGNWPNPTLQPIDERLLLTPNGGIVAALTPVGSGVNTGHKHLLAGVLPAFTAKKRLGEAQLAGLAALAQSGRNQDLLFTYGILGDPDIALPATEAPSTYLPLVSYGKG